MSGGEQHQGEQPDQEELDLGLSEPGRTESLEAARDRISGEIGRHADELYEREHPPGRRPRHVSEGTIDERAAQHVADVAAGDEEINAGVSPARKAETRDHPLASVSAAEAALTDEQLRLADSDRRRDEKLAGIAADEADRRELASKGRERVRMAEEGSANSQSPAVSDELGEAEQDQAEKDAHAGRKLADDLIEQERRRRREDKTSEGLPEA